MTQWCHRKVLSPPHNLSFLFRQPDSSSLKSETSMSDFTKLSKIHSTTINWRSIKQAITLMNDSIGKSGESGRWHTQQWEKVDKPRFSLLNNHHNKFKDYKKVLQIDVLKFHLVHSVKGNWRADQLAASPCLMETLSLQWPPKEHWKCWLLLSIPYIENRHCMFKLRHCMWFFMVCLVFVSEEFPSLITQPFNYQNK